MHVFLVRADAENALLQIDLYIKKVMFRGQGPKLVYPILSASKELRAAAGAEETSTKNR
jgi:hypothetical protein